MHKFTLFWKTAYYDNVVHFSSLNENNQINPEFKKPDLMGNNSSALEVFFLITEEEIKQGKLNSTTFKRNNGTQK